MNYRKGDLVVHDGFRIGTILDVYGPIIDWTGDCSKILVRFSRFYHTGNPVWLREDAVSPLKSMVDLREFLR